MAFSALGTVVVLGLAFLLIAGGNMFLMIPIVVIGLILAVVLPLATAALRKTAIGSEDAPSGVPTTSEASYDARVEPR